MCILATVVVVVFVISSAFVGIVVIGAVSAGTFIFALAAGLLVGKGAGQQTTSGLVVVGAVVTRLCGGRGRLVGGLLGVVGVQGLVAREHGVNAALLGVGQGAAGLGLGVALVTIFGLVVGIDEAGFADVFVGVVLGPRAAVTRPGPGTALSGAIVGSERHDGHG